LHGERTYSECLSCRPPTSMSNLPPSADRSTNKDRQVAFGENPRPGAHGTAMPARDRLVQQGRTTGVGGARALRVEGSARSPPRSSVGATTATMILGQSPVVRTVPSMTAARL